MTAGLLTAADDLKVKGQTVVYITVNGRPAGLIGIADAIKPSAKQAIDALHAQNIQVIMMTGDNQKTAEAVAEQLGIDHVFAEVMPDEKAAKVKELQSQGKIVAMAGDGVNDAPVLALADAGIAMGGLGSDAAIETADIVIQNDQPAKLVMAIKAGRITRNLVWQNITIAMLIKVAVLVLGAAGIASLWEAVIADVGVAMLAILNAVRIQRMRL